MECSADQGFVQIKAALPELVDRAVDRAPRLQKRAPTVSRSFKVSGATEFTPKQPGDYDVLRLAFKGAVVGACRWPIGDPCDDDFRFCCESARGTYCAGHARIAYVRAA